jgi:diacylglycerol kinase (ATP)
LKPDKSQPQKFSLRKRFGSFRFAFKGIIHAFTQEHNFRIHFLAAILVIAAGFYFELRMVGWTLILFAIGFVLVAELFNSAIELLADVVSPEENKTIGKVKDIAAGAVLVAVIVAVIIGIIVFWNPVRAVCGI